MIFFSCLIPAMSACLISGNSLSWHRGVRVQHAKVIRSPRLSLVILGSSVRLMELWGQAGGGIRDKDVLNVSKGILQGHSKWQQWFLVFPYPKSVHQCLCFTKTWWAMHSFCLFTKLDKSSRLSLLWNLDHTCIALRKENFEDAVCCTVCNTRPTAGPEWYTLPSYVPGVGQNKMLLHILWKEIHWSPTLEPHLSFILWLPVILSVDDFVLWMTTVWQVVIPQELPERNQNLMGLFWFQFCCNANITTVFVWLSSCFLFVWPCSSSWKSQTELQAAAFCRVTYVTLYFLQGAW